MISIPRSTSQLFPILFESFKSDAIQYATKAFDRFNDISERWRDDSSGHQRISTPASSIRFNRGAQIVARHKYAVLPPRMQVSRSFTSISSNRLSVLSHDQIWDFCHWVHREKSASQRDAPQSCLISARATGDLVDAGSADRLQASGVLRGLRLRRTPRRGLLRRRKQQIGRHTEGAYAAPSPC